jgi:hypothetical protein
LSWSHVKLLLPLKSDEARAFYAAEVAAKHLGVRELRDAIRRKAFERREIANAQIPLGSAVPLDVFRDLLFYSRLQRRLVAIELKIGPFEAAYFGQMRLYLRWLDRYERQPGEETPIGLILCTEANRAEVELLGMEQDGIAVAEYWTALPPKGELTSRIQTMLRDARERLARRELTAAAESDDGVSEIGTADS